MMTIELIFYIMLNMLVSDNIKPQYLADPRVQAHLYEVAEAIHDNRSGVDPHRLIALAYKETRFGYDPRDLSNGVACGVYQQVPSTAMRKITCGELVTDVTTATELAVLYIKYVDRRWGEREGLSQRMCHYYSGNLCGDKSSRDYVRKYRRALSKSRDIYFSMYSEGDDEISDRYIRELSDEILLNAHYRATRKKAKSLRD